jgi:hypothetical protein
MQAGTGLFSSFDNIKPDCQCHHENPLKMWSCDCENMSLKFNIIVWVGKMCRNPVRRKNVSGQLSRNRRKIKANPSVIWILYLFWATGVILKASRLR